MTKKTDSAAEKTSKGKKKTKMNPSAAKPKTHDRDGSPGQKEQNAATPGNPEPLYQDFDAMTEYLTDVSGRSQDIILKFFGRRPDIKNFARGNASADPLNIGNAYQEMVKGFSADPGKVAQRQFILWGEYAQLMANMQKRFMGESAQPSISPEKNDKRFRHPAWDENPMLDFTKQSYLVFARWLEETMESVDGLDEHEKAKAIFYTRQFIDACSPTNIPVLNPEVVEETIESKGENLLKGLNNFLEDVDRGDGNIAIRQADLDFFELGKNIATTPGKVVYRNDLFELIQYAPVTDEVAETPLLIVPPWINKFYILDLQPNNSFIKWAVEQGRTVFVISWVNPGPELKDKNFEDYIKEGLFEALDAVADATGSAKADAIGYCIGGTMLSTALALMARRRDDRINSATFFTAQADFKEAGDLLLFVDDEQLDSIEKQMDAAGGVLEGRSMATTFNMLRSNDLIWSFVIDNYMKGKDPAKFDLLFWNSDATRMPKNVHLFYLREFYQHNRLANSEMVIDGETLDLSEVSIPIYMQAGETDHIAPHNSVYRTARLYASGANKNVTYMLAGSGHIAGVINHPDKKKYHYSTNSELPATIADWKSGAKRRPGSWWPHWLKWLNKQSSGKTEAREPGDSKLKILCDAPGTYVRVKS